MTTLLRHGLIGCLSLALLAGCAAAPVAAPPQASATVVVPTASPSVRAVTPSSSVAASPPATIVPTTPPLALASVSNFRDVAGDGLVLADGGRMATGVVYRSAKLKGITKADRTALAAAGVTDIYDLRTPTVAGNSPDPKVSGVSYHLINVFAVRKTPPVNPSSVARARAHMTSMNRAFVTDPAQRKAIAKVLRAIAGAQGPVLIHCTEGKDRTGWISALLQLVAGASEPQVVEEYLKSNSYRADLIDAAVARAKKAGGTKAAAIEEALLRVDEDYLTAGLDELATRYGDLDGYLTEGLGLKPQTVAALRARLRTA